MRASLTLLAIALALGACHKGGGAGTSSSSAAIPGAGEPRLASGLWEQRVSDRHGAAVTQLCLDDASAGALAYFGRQLNNRCTRHDMAQASDGSWHFATQCDMGAGGKVATEGVMRGDFKSRYQIEALSQTTGAASPALNGPRRMLVEVRRLGDCPKDMKAGDVVLPGGARTTIAGLSAPA